MSLDEKIVMIGSYNLFFTRGFEKYGIPILYFSDATQGVHIRKQLDAQLEKSVAFPCPIALTSTWNSELAKTYAKCIGEECRAGDIAVFSFWDIESNSWKIEPGKFEILVGKAFNNIQQTANFDII